MRWNPIVKNLARLRSVQTHQQLHQSGLPCPRWPDKGNRVSASCAESDFVQCQTRGTLMLKTDPLKLQRHELVNRFRVRRLRVARSVEDLLKILQRNLGFAINIDDVSQFLQRPENIKRIN